MYDFFWDVSHNVLIPKKKQVLEKVVGGNNVAR